MANVGPERYCTRRKAPTSQCPITRSPDLRCSSTTSSSPVWMVVSTDIPTRSSLAKGCPGVTTILTGSRCTILVKLPVALLAATDVQQINLSIVRLEIDLVERHHRHQRRPWTDVVADLHGTLAHHAVD